MRELGAYGTVLIQCIQFIYLCYGSMVQVIIISKAGHPATSIRKFYMVLALRKLSCKNIRRRTTLSTILRRTERLSPLYCLLVLIEIEKEPYLLSFDSANEILIRERVSFVSLLFFLSFNSLTQLWNQLFIQATATGRGVKGRRAALHMSSLPLTTGSDSSFFPHLITIIWWWFSSYRYWFDQVAHIPSYELASCKQQ